MNPTAQATLSRARRSTPAPVFTTEPVKASSKPLPMPVPTGAINNFMRMQAQAEARDIVLAHKAKLNDVSGLAQVIELLKRACIDRPGSVVRGFLDVIELIQRHGK